MSAPLTMWTIYDHPVDWPDWYVAREFTISGGPDDPVASDSVLLHRHLEPIRDFLRRKGLVCLMRNPEDHPNVVETWL